MVEEGGRVENSWKEGGGCCVSGIGEEWGGGGGHFLDAFVLLLLGFEALTGGDGCLEVWGIGMGLALGTKRRKKKMIAYPIGASDRRLRALGAFSGLRPSL